MSATLASGLTERSLDHRTVNAVERIEPMRMVTFRLNRECRDITINPEKVVYVAHYEHGASCIHFGRECFVRVQGEVSEVVRKIEAGLNDHEFASAEPDHPAEGLAQSGVN